MTEKIAIMGAGCQIRRASFSDLRRLTLFLERKRHPAGNGC